MPSVLVRHPSPLLYVPRGGRHPVGALVMRETPVEMHEARDDIVPAVPSRKGEAGPRGVLHRNDEGYWIPLGVPPGFVGPAMTRRAFLRWLANPGASAPRGFERQLGGTPLLGAWRRMWSPFRPAYYARPVAVPLPSHDMHASRGDPVEILEGARAVTWDGTEAARDRLRRFLDEEIRITRTGTFLRARPLVTLRKDGEATFEVRLHLSRRLGQGDVAFPVRPDRAEAALRTWTRPGTSLSEAATRALARMDPAFFDDADIDLFANQLPVMAVSLSNDAGVSRAVDLRIRAATRDLVEPLRPAALSGLVGGNGGPGAEAILVRSRPALEALYAAFGSEVGAKGVGRALRQLDREVLPRVRGVTRPLDSDDAEALGLLAP